MNALAVRGSAPAPLDPRSRPRVVAVVGNPNTGKSTLFNCLSGLRQKVGNYPGVTVERHVGMASLDGIPAELVDLPGTYSLAARSPDELVTVAALSGDGELPRPDAVLVVVDATSLRRNLFLLTQVMELGLPVVVALTMGDLLASRGVEVAADRLAERLDLPVVPVVASSGAGVAGLRAALRSALAGPPARPPVVIDEIDDGTRSLVESLGRDGVQVSALEARRALVDVDGAAQRRLEGLAGPGVTIRLEELRRRLGAGRTLAEVEAGRRYAFIDRLVGEVETRQERVTWSDRIDRVVGHRVVGPLVFLGLMALVFQAVFSWAVPLMDAVEMALAGLAGVAGAVLPDGALQSMVVDGIIGGVGSVLVFVPQILVLFAFLFVLEDSGYMARAAFLIDRLMRGCGLSGHAFIPMLSSFACAVPGIMATRVIADRRDRFATIVAAPFMTCSARLPVYALLIAALVPQRTWLGGVVNLHGLVLLGLYLLGIAGGVGTALLLKRTVLRGPAPPFLLEIPPYRWPDPRSVGLRLLQRGRLFLVRAGTVIFAASLVVWALAYFPHSDRVDERFDRARGRAEASLSGDELAGRLEALDREEASAQMEGSLLARAGRLVEPAFRPLGWDWKVSAAVLASFPAREVVVATLGTLYAVGTGDGGDEAALGDRLARPEAPGEAPVLDTATALGLMVFMAFCLQCVSTMAVMRRETNSWRWPVGAWLWMTALAYGGAWLTVRLVGGAG